MSTHTSLYTVVTSTRVALSTQETIKRSGAYYDSESARTRKDLLAAGQDPLSTVLGRIVRGTDKKAYRIRQNDGSSMEIWIDEVIL